MSLYTSLPSRLHRFEQGVMEERNQRDKEVQEKKAACARFKNMHMQTTMVRKQLYS